MVLRFETVEEKKKEKKRNGRFHFAKVKPRRKIKIPVI